VGGNYEKDLFRHLQETMAKVDCLTGEITTLRKETTQKIEALESENQQLKKENHALRTENQKLKDIIDKNSGNSSKPPSSDGFVKIQNSREKTGKKPGGQFGHKGKVHKLLSNPTQIEDIKAAKCECGGRVKYWGKYTAKQFVDIEFTTAVIEYREHEGVCECCLGRVKNYAPVNDIITYGRNLKSFSAMLSLEGMVSIGRIRQIISELSDGQLNLSDGTIAKWNKDLSSHVAPAIGAIKGKLLVAPILHKDETGIRINKTLNWLHVLGNDKYTLYHAHKKRGNEADKAIGILPAYSGVLVHDHLVGLYDFLCTHSECNAHVLRYLKAAIEKKKRVWAEDMIKLLLEAKTAVDGSAKPLHNATVRKFHRRYDEVLKRGREEFLKSESPDYNGEDMKLLRRLKKYKTEHLRFISNPKVPFDNNQAERDLRMIKAKTKISGCFRAADGGEVFAALKSYTSTLRKNGCNIFDGIRLAFAGHPVLC
jgi:regulator of replication initiation timing/transposase